MVSKIKEIADSITDKDLLDTYSLPHFQHILDQKGGREKFADEVLSDPLGAVGTFASSVLLDLPELYPPIHNKLKKHRHNFPETSKALEHIAFIPSMYVAAKAGQGVKYPFAKAAKWLNPTMTEQFGKSVAQRNGWPLFLKNVIDAAATGAAMSPGITAKYERPHLLKQIPSDMFLSGATAGGLNIGAKAIKGIVAHLPIPKRMVNFIKKLGKSLSTVEEAQGLAAEDSKDLYNFITLGDNESLMELKGLYDTTPEGRAILHELKEKFTNAQAGEIEHAMLKLRSQGIPTLDAYKQALNQKRNAATNALYEKAKKRKHIPLPISVTEEPYYQKALNTSMNMYPERVRNPQSGLILNETKKELRRMVKKEEGKLNPFKIDGNQDRSLLNRLEEVESKFTNALKRQVPEIKKALRIQRRGYAKSDALLEGYEAFTDLQSLNDITNKVKGLSKKQLSAFRVGWLNALREQFMGRDKFMNFPQIARALDNPTTKKKAAVILGDKAATPFLKRIRNINKAQKNLAEFTTGSKTPEEFGNMNSNFWSRYLVYPTRAFKAGLMQTLGFPSLLTELGTVNKMWEAARSPKKVRAILDKLAKVEPIRKQITDTANKWIPLAAPQINDHFKSLKKETYPN